MAVVWRDAVLVVGMGRSGTSALTRILSLCGGALPRELLAPNHGNPTGYWEPARALDINDRFLTRHGSSWYDPTLRLQLASSRPIDAEFVYEIQRFLMRDFETRGPLIVKDPRISGLLPFWLQAATTAGLRTIAIHVFRHPTDVAASLTVRDYLATEHSIALWMKYNLVAERDTRSIPRVFVSYEDLIRDWEPIITSCIDALGLSLEIDDSTRREVDAFLSPDLQHHRTRGTTGDTDTFPVQLVRETYEMLNDAKMGNCDVVRFERVRRAYEMSGVANRIVPETAAGLQHA